MGQILLLRNLYIIVYLPILFSCGWWSILEPAVTPLRSSMQSENILGIRDFPSVYLFIPPCRHSGSYLCRKLKLAAFTLLVFSVWCLRLNRAELFMRLPFQKQLLNAIRHSKWYKTRKVKLLTVYLLGLIIAGAYSWKLRGLLKQAKAMSEASISSYVSLRTAESVQLTCTQALVGKWCGKCTFKRLLSLPVLLQGLLPGLLMSISRT